MAGGAARRRIVLALHPHGTTVEEFQSGGLRGVVHDKAVGFDVLFVQAPLLWDGAGGGRAAAWFEGPIQLPVPNAPPLCRVPEEATAVLEKACTAFKGEIEGVLGCGEGAYLAMCLLAELGRGAAPAWLPEFRFSVLIAPPPALCGAVYSLHPHGNTARALPAAFPPGLLSYHAAPPGARLPQFTHPVRETAPAAGAAFPSALAPSLALFLTLCHASSRGAWDGRNAFDRLLRAVPADPARRRRSPAPRSAGRRASSPAVPAQPCPPAAWCAPKHEVVGSAARRDRDGKGVLSLGVEVRVEAAKGTPRFPKQSSVATPDDVVVTGVAPGGAAEAMGLREGDMLLAIGGFAVHSRKGLQAAVQAAAGERGVAVKVRRGGEVVARRWDVYRHFLNSIEHLAAVAPRYAGVDAARLAPLLWNNELPLYLLALLPPGLPSRDEYAAAVAQCLADVGLPAAVDPDAAYRRAAGKSELVREAAAGIEADFAAALRDAARHDVYAEALRTARRT